MKRKVISYLLVFLFFITIGAQNTYAATLRAGSKGSEVKYVQERLISKGFLKGKADGIFGSGTKSAVMSFQRSVGLKADGVVGSLTLSKLSTAGSTQSSGSTSSKPSTPTTPTAPSTQPSRGTAITSILKVGSRGAQVVALQNLLNQLGYKVGKADGVFGNGTKAAVMAFQRSKGLKADGVVGSTTVSKLAVSTPSQPSVPNPAPQQQPAPQNPQTSPSTVITSTLKVGSRGTQVVALQNRLNQLGYKVGKADGVFGSGTRAAVIAFQRSKGLGADGVVGKMTVAKLFPPVVQPTPQPEPQPTPAPQPETPQFREFHGEAGKLTGYTVILDAGHGGSDSGATRSGVYEKNITLDITKRVKRILEEAGARVELTRTDDKFYSLFYRSSFANSYVLSSEITSATDEKQNDVTLIGQKGTLKTSKEQEKATKAQTLVDLNTQLQQLQGELDRLTNQLDELKKQPVDGQAPDIQTQIADLENQISVLENQIAAVNADLTSTGDAITTLSNEISTLASDITALNADVDEKTAVISDLNEKLSSFNDYVNNPSKDTRSGIYGTTASKLYATNNLSEVFDLTKEKYDDNTIFMSIHVNSSDETDQTSASGVQVYVRGNGPSNYGTTTEYYNNYDFEKRVKLGQSLLNSINQETPFSKKYTSVYDKDLSVLRENNLVSSLVEIGFMNNSKDRSMLLQEQSRENIAGSLYKGIAEYFK